MEPCITNSRDKTHEKNLGARNWVQNYGFWDFLKVASLVFLDITHDFSLRQCLTSSRAETSKLQKKIFFYVHSNLFLFLKIGAFNRKSFPKHPLFTIFSLLLTVSEVCNILNINFQISQVREHFNTWQLTSLLLYRKKFHPPLQRF